MEIHEVPLKIRVTLSRIEIWALVFAKEGKSETQRKLLGVWRRSTKKLNHMRRQVSE